MWLLRPADRLNQAALSAPDGVTLLADVRKAHQRENTIANWTPLLHEIRAHPRVTASAVMAQRPRRGAAGRRAQIGVADGH